MKQMFVHSPHRFDSECFKALVSIDTAGFEEQTTLAWFWSYVEARDTPRHPLAKVVTGNLNLKCTVECYKTHQICIDGICRHASLERSWLHFDFISSTDKQEGKASVQQLLKFCTGLQDYPPMGLDAPITIEFLKDGVLPHVLESLSCQGI